MAVRTRAVVEALEGDGRVARARVRGPDGAAELAVDAVFVCVGPEPASEGFGVATDARGYVRVDRLQRTSRPHVLAVGDVCCPEAPTNAEFTAALAAALHRPAVLRAPAFVLRPGAGQMAPELLGSVRPRPQVLLDAGFEFADHDIRAVLAAALPSQ